MPERKPIQIGDVVRHKLWWPMFPDVKVVSVGRCDDDGCILDTIGFIDPENGQPDEAHMDEFRLAPQGATAP